MYESERCGHLTTIADDATEVRARVADGSLGHLPASALHDLTRRWVAAVDELDAVGAGLLAAWDGQGVWDLHGARSGRAWLSNTAALAHASARLRVAVGLARRCPKTLEALVAGELGYQQASVIANVVTDDLVAFFEPVEEQVLGWARTSSVRDLRMVMARWRVLAENLADVEPDERRHHERNTSVHETLNGMVAINALFEPDKGHVAMAAIDQVAEQLRRDDQAAYDAAGDTDPAVGTSPGFPDRRRNLTQRRADALAMLIEAGARHHDACDRDPGGPNARVHIFLPWQVFAAYLATRPTDGETTGRVTSTDGEGDGDGGTVGAGGADSGAACAGGVDEEVRTLAAEWAAVVGIPATPAGLGDALFGAPGGTFSSDGASSHGASSDVADPAGPLFGLGATFERLARPVDLTMLERLLCDSALARMVLDANGVPVDMGRAVRTATRAQRRALAARDGGCAFPGCHVPAHLTQAHHIKHWEDQGPTDIDNLVLLCPHHHRRLHRARPHRWSCRIDATTRRPVFTPPDSDPAHGDRSGTARPRDALPGNSYPVDVREGGAQRRRSSHDRSPPDRHRPTESTVHRPSASNPDGRQPTLQAAALSRATQAP
jgi:hypothetical protein